MAFWVKIPSRTRAYLGHKKVSIYGIHRSGGVRFAAGSPIEPGKQQGAGALERLRCHTLLKGVKGMELSPPNWILVE
jgi:hypothetical protein